jgi:hypothetical protein
MKVFMIILFLALFFKCAAPGYSELVILKSQYESNQLTWSNIDFYLNAYNIREPEKVKKQIYHETGNLKSRLCKEQNNLFGMRLARLRQTTAIGEGNHMAKYRSWQKSIEDYGIWQDKYYSDGDYYKFLSDYGYATDIWYTWKLKKIKAVL